MSYGKEAPMQGVMTSRAAEIVALPYSIHVDEDETTTGHPIYVARITELEGCIAQGQTIQEALRNLREAAIDYVVSLLEDGAPIPPPSSPVTAASSSTASTVFVAESQALESPAYPSEPSRLFEFQFTSK
jgi:predicted RNase H-like HicB family nuclease